MINLNEIDFRVAFTVEGYHSRDMKNDHRYVKYLVRIFGRHKGQEYERILQYHKCTDEDWVNFAPPSKTSADSWKEINSSPKRGFMCIDFEEGENLKIYGNERNDEYQRIEIVLVPCNYLHSHLGYRLDRIHEDCVADLDKQIEYLGSIDVLLYHTEELFMQKNYGEDTIVKNSYLYN